jgi:hypothetical protein
VSTSLRVDIDPTSDKELGLDMLDTMELRSLSRVNKVFKSHKSVFPNEKEQFVRRVAKKYFNRK